MSKKLFEYIINDDLKGVQTCMQEGIDIEKQ